MRHLFASLVFLILGFPASAQDDKGKAAYDRGDYALALQEWLPLAENGHPSLQNMIGLIYADKLKPSDDHAVEAIKWYRRAADQGFALAQYKLGVSYRHGRGVPVDINEATKWYRRLGEQGLIFSQDALCKMYAYGSGVRQDYSEAVMWCHKAAEQGSASAQFELGLRYAYGEGIPQDYVKAVKWYKMSAEQGDSSAPLFLGNVYYEMRNFVEAVKWYRQAADRGDVSAQSHLGGMYQHGQGVKRDNVQAHMWLNLAAARGDKSAKGDRDALAKQMTAAEIVAAQKRARDWKAEFDKKNQ